jgi:flavin reductase (DIM6/NTAB) family NADH-FMN oxidoreductase RutF
MFREISIDKLDKNLVSLIRDEWALISVGKREKYNMMTASWGFFGEMWNKDCAVCAIRPQRYTYGIMEENDYFALVFLGDNKAPHKVCGSMSGRDVNKTELTGLTPVFSDNTVYFEEAETVIICKKLYADTLKEKNFTDESPLSCYKGDYHKMYVGEIIKVLVKE